LRHFPHHIGDYAAATSHLSFLEDAAYHRCLRRYYQDEKPLPVDPADVQRLVGARTRDEKNAVRVVLQEFFTLQDDGWHQNRADEEIAAYRSRVETARENGRKSAGRPKPTDNQVGLSRDTKEKPNPIRTDQLTNNHEPITNHDSEAKASDGAPSAGKALWDEGVAYLTSHGNTEKNARSVIGGWRKKHGDERTHAGIKAAKEQDISEPVAWITEWLKAPQNAAPPRTAEEAMAQISGWKGLA
jgi:uncharacterized protein YdaU (DUF1376 family)